MENKKPAVLVLADGTVYNGIAIGATGTTTGEIAFYLNEASDIGGKSSDGGLLNLALIDLSIGGGKVPPEEFQYAS